MAPITSTLLPNVGSLSTKEFVSDLVGQILMGCLRQNIDEKSKSLLSLKETRVKIYNDKMDVNNMIASFATLLDFHTDRIYDLSQSDDNEEDLNEIFEEIFLTMPLMKMMYIDDVKLITDQIVTYVKSKYDDDE